MKDQINTIRAALEQAKENTTHGQIAWNCKEALTSLSELERMAGEPVAKVVLTEKLDLPCLQWLDLTRQFDFNGGEFLYAAPPVQQPQAEPTTLTNAFLADVMTAAGLVSHGKQCKALGERLGAEVARLRTAAPQQAEAGQWPAGSVTLHTQLLDMGKHMAKERSREIGDAWNQLADLLTLLAKARNAPQQAESVPPGFVIVPVEPTDAMWNAMMDYGTKKSEWRAILAAAPKAEAVPLLSEKEIVKCLTAAGCVGTIKMSYDSGPYEITRTSINADRFARAIEQAARAKMGAGVPMTHAERTAALIEQYHDNDCLHMWSFLDGIRAAEKFHGIVGKEGA